MAQYKPTPNPKGITVEQATEYCNRVISGWKSAIRDAPFRTPSYEEHDKTYAPILESLRVEVEKESEFLKANGYYPWAKKPKWVREREKAANRAAWAAEKEMQKERRKLERERLKLEKQQAKQQPKRRGRPPKQPPAGIPGINPKIGKNYRSKPVGGGVTA